MAGNLETDNPLHNIVLLVVSILVCTAGLLAIVAMRRASRIPYAPKLLSQLLLSLDIVLLSTSCVRRFLEEPVVNIQFNVFGMLTHITAVVTVTAMTIERLFIFVWPHAYMRVVTPSKLRLIVIVTWLSVAFLFYFTRFFICSRLLEEPITVFYVPWVCNRIMLIYDVVVAVTCYVINVICYIVIYVLIRKKEKSSPHTYQRSKLTMNIFSYKSTSFVLLTFVVILVNSVSSIGLVFIVKRGQISVGDTRLVLDCLRLVNCIADTFMYSLWFTESRIEVLKMFAPISKRCLQAADRMKFDTFNIVIYKSHNNRVHPIDSDEENK